MQNEPERLLRTLRYLKPVQITNRLLRKIPRSVRFPAVPLRERQSAWIPPIQYEPVPLRDQSRLSEYTLHYHHLPTREMIQRWMAETEPGRGAGWEPYPISRRLVNWIRYLLNGSEPEDGMLESMAAQADFVARSVEHHLLANHLFVNAKALVFAGCFFQADRWLAQGLNLLRREIPEQILADGGHFERSPMYHSLILEDMLDLRNLGRAYPGLVPDWTSVAARMLGWLQRITHPDGRLPFFNDTTFGVAPEPGLLFEYAQRLGIKADTGRLGESGYIRLENDQTVVLFDAGPIGPDYQPGHAHADTLSFELSHRGRRLLVNSGISTYEAGAERQWQRGTAAHNTVRIDGLDQSEMWGAFRVARRARPFDVQTDHSSWAEASHDGYKRLRDPITHRRRLELGDGHLTVTDSLEGRGIHQVELFFHQHPEAEVKIDLDSRLTRSIDETSFHPQFEQAIPKTTVTARYCGVCPIKFQTEILLEDPVPER